MEPDTLKTLAVIGICILGFVLSIITAKRCGNCARGYPGKNENRKHRWKMRCVLDNQLYSCNHYCGKYFKWHINRGDEMEPVSVINALNGLTWPGAIGLLALSVAAVGIAFAVAWLYRGL